MRSWVASSLLMIVLGLVGSAAVYGVVGWANPPHQPGLTERQARLVVRSYADIHHFGQFSIVRCRREARGLVGCRVHEAPYLDDGTGTTYDSYVFRVRRHGCGFDAQDNGSGGSGEWRRWL